MDLDKLKTCVKSLRNGKAAEAAGMLYEMLKSLLQKIETHF